MKVRVTDIIAARAEADAALERMLRDQDKPCCHERLEQLRLANNHERDIIRKWTRQ